MEIEVARINKRATGSHKWAGGSLLQEGVMRADAKQNYEQLLLVAHEVVAEQGVEASLRDIARRANVGWATLLRHFPTREALLDDLLKERLHTLTHSASMLEASESPSQALVIWLRQAVAFVDVYSGIVTIMASSLSDTGSALHSSCVELRKAGARLLERAQLAKVARPDLNGEDLFALIGALGWIGDQSHFAHRSNVLFNIVAGAIFINGTVADHPSSGP
ncbi:TetR/AcrR family transcriptional regulator [Rhizobium laguerreae]|uniref:TetR/AcrR family transcriptional regulator n=2 Tax=Rhizobium TaxID=379 RepID=UPI0028B23FD3|nr:helix-turn-helix domain-containing protein [Rhizobium laguerreae]